MRDKLPKKTTGIEFKCRTHQKSMLAQLTNKLMLWEEEAKRFYFHFDSKFGSFSWTISTDSDVWLIHWKLNFQWQMLQKFTILNYLKCSFLSFCESKSLCVTNKFCMC